MGNRVEEQVPIPFPPLLQSQRSLKEQGGDRGRAGGGCLPNNVFRVWGKGNPPVVGFDDGGHRGLLWGHATLDVLVILLDAADTGTGDRGLGVRTTDSHARPLPTS